jgi:thiamine biosynthesis lipoprotein
MRLVACEADRITLQNGAELDLGAIAKGYAADCCRAILERAGVSGILSLGGNIQTVGKKPDGSDWTVAIQDPDDPGRYLLTMTVTGTKSVVTSGDYQRFFERDGIRYCHILNPATLSPARNGLRMVTIVADEGFLADGLSTALFVMGLERGIEFWRAGNDFEAIWLTEDGTVTVTEGLEDRISYKNAEVVRR